MGRRKIKTSFVGFKVTTEQATLLAALQERFNLATKTDVLTRGINLLAKLYLPDSDYTLVNPSEADEQPSQIATSFELARLEAAGRHYNMNLQRIKTKSREVIQQVAQELSKTDEIVDKYEGDKSALIQVLLDLQHENHWLSENTLKWVGKKLGVPLTQIYHVATFYKAFSLVPRGRHSVTVCLGTACQVRGAPRLLYKVASVLRIKPGETSRDMRFNLDTVNCLGCCALGPVMVVDGKYYSNPSTKEIGQIISACE